MEKIEILSPAGSYESLIAAVNAGCDAIYIGGSQFGARANANNLNEQEMLEAIDYVHIHNKKIYLTINTLLKNEELKTQLYQYLSKIYVQGIDAVIVQDMGVMHFIHKNFPELPIHASTQMTLTMAQGAKVFQQLGVTRLVSSRELSLEEIKVMSKNTDMEIESFVHGALCYCYSGQCLMSSMIGGRSGNRGRCAQPCRMTYSLKKNGTVLSNQKERYLLSPKDICTIELIPDLIEAGITSFKIEGRMKRPEYTALTTSVYRKYVDLYLELGRSEYEKYLIKNRKELENDVKNLMDLYNRGEFTSGYYKCYNGKSMMSMRRPNHNGVIVGKVVSLKGNRAKFQLKQDINGQDVLEFRGKDNNILYEYTVKNSSVKGEEVEANYKHGSNIKVGDLLYRTKNQKLLTELNEWYLTKEKKELIHGTFIALSGQKMKLELFGFHTNIEVTGDLVEPAQKQPITREKIINQLSKTNATSFCFDKLEVIMDENIFIPIGKLNEIRRNAVERFIYERLQTYRRVLKESVMNESVNKEGKKPDTKYGIHVYVKSLEQLSVAVSFKEVKKISIYSDNIELSQIPPALEAMSNKNKEIFIVLPSIFRKDTYELFEKLLKNESNIFNHPLIHGLVLKNFEEFEFFQSHGTDMTKKEIILDYNMYIMNEETKLFWNEMSVTHFTAPVELNFDELKNLGCTDMDIIVYGYLPLMTSAQCLLKNTKGCTKEPEIYHLSDKFNNDYICLNHCQYCYNIIYNNNPISLMKNKGEIETLNPKNIRLDFTIEGKKEMEVVLKNFIEVFCYNKDTKFDLQGYTKGHFKRGIE